MDELPDSRIIELKIIELNAELKGRRCCCPSCR